MIGTFGAFEFALADRYRFEEELGRGAMGAVFRATDVRLGRPVAIKLLHPALTNAAGARRFLAEIKIVAGLHHPAIVGVHDSGQADGQLFYVMDYLGGETLRSRLHREKQLSLEDALQITEQVAEALQYAHDHGVVHRDVKPENIVLAEGRACVVDFGLARALGDVDAERLTASGFSVGTPHYLSPEQASAEKDVGPKADQYALACVLYELLAGEPPFTGPTAAAIAMRHVSQDPIPIRARRKNVTFEVETAILRALEKVPADRHSDLNAFVAALRNPVVDLPKTRQAAARRAPRLGKKSIAIGAVSLLLVALLAKVVGTDALDDGMRWVTGRSLDTNKYAIFPLVSRGQQPAIDIHSKISEALLRWNGLTVAENAEVTDGATQLRGSATIANQERIARSLRAGRFITGSLERYDTTLRVTAELHRAGAVARRVTYDLSGSSATVDSAASSIAYAMIFPELEVDEELANGATRSRLAVTAYARGTKSLRRWNLPEADSAFSEALRYDAAFSQAALRLAQTRIASRDNVPELSALTTRALAAPSRLSVTSREHAKALSEVASSKYLEACGRYEGLVGKDAMDIAAWYGVMSCNLANKRIAVDERTPGRYVFQASANRAQVALAEALTRTQVFDPCCLVRLGQLMRRAYFTSPTRAHYGRTAAGEVLMSYPELRADTIALVPQSTREHLLMPGPTHLAAVQQQRSRFFQLAARFLGQSPSSADAMELIAEAIEMQGNEAAVDSMRRARQLSTLPSQQLRLAVRETWLRIKFALPGRIADLKVAKQSTDSLLASAKVLNAEDASLLASLAAITGDVYKTASLAERSAEGESATVPVPIEIFGTARAYLAYASLGGPADSLRELQRRLASAIESGVEKDKQAAVNDMYLARAASLAYPSVPGMVLGKLDTANDYLLLAEAAHARGDKRKVREILEKVARDRSGLIAAGLTFDALYPEAWLLSEIGDKKAAVERIEPSLNAIRAMPVSKFADLAMAGALLQSMKLYSVLMSEQGEPSARRWKDATAALTGRP